MLQGAAHDDGVLAQVGCGVERCEGLHRLGGVERCSGPIREEHHDPIAHVLVDDAPVQGEHRAHRCVDAVEKRKDLVGTERLGPPGEPLDVEEADREVPNGLVSNRELPNVGVVEEGEKGRRDEAPEGREELFALPEQTLVSERHGRTAAVQREGLSVPLGQLEGLLQVQRCPGLWAEVKAEDAVFTDPFPSAGRRHLLQEGELLGAQERAHGSLYLVCEPTRCRQHPGLVGLGVEQGSGADEEQRVVPRVEQSTDLPEDRLQQVRHRVGLEQLARGLDDTLQRAALLRDGAQIPPGPDGSGHRGAELLHRQVGLRVVAVDVVA